MDYVHYREYVDLGSLTFARLTSHRFSSSLLVPLLYLLPLPWPCLILRFTSTSLHKIRPVCPKEMCTKYTFDQYHLFPVVFKKYLPILLAN